MAKPILSSDKSCGEFLTSLGCRALVLNLLRRVLLATGVEEGSQDMQFVNILGSLGLALDCMAWITH